jgi:leucyl-tRNA synthetase
MAREPYDHQHVEPKWQEVWQKTGAFTAPEVPGKRKAYILDMFPYPSGDGLHVGHPEGYTASDIYSRYLRMRGRNVLHPMGWDAFGLPAENYAIKSGTQPSVTTAKNIETFKRQIQALGFSYDWSREVNTTDPGYYKWTQWIFLKLFEKGLAYEAEAPINWCPKDKTGLANEEVVGGKCERCGTAVEKKNIRQWLVKITDAKYVERLLNGLDTLDWPESIKHLQRNWIGKSVGAEVTFDIPVSSHYVLLHGFTGTPKANFFPWLKAQLEKTGARVDVPALPNTDNANIDEQVTFVEKHVKLTERTVLLGHSLGAVVALKVLVKSKTRIAKLILAGGFLEPKFKDHERPFAKTTDWKIDFSAIRKHVESVTVLRAREDYAVPEEQAEKLHHALGGTLKEVITEEPHFCGTSEPTLLTECVQPLTVFTTRPDTLFGATYMVLAPEHSLVSKVTTPDQQKHVVKYQKQASQKSDIDRTDLAKAKTGVFTGAYATNPVNREKIPIWIADYVLSSYGTGAIMAVPAHDERDYAFAKQYGLPIVEVIQKPAGFNGQCYSGTGDMQHSGDFNGMRSEEFQKVIVEWLERERKGKAATNYKLRDWVFSRQRYWGEPIPLVHCATCKQDVLEHARELHFSNQASWQKIVDGRKTVETRALNPGERGRYFGDIGVGDYLKLVNMLTNATLYYRVTDVEQYGGLRALLKDTKNIQRMAFEKPCKDVPDLEAEYGFTLDYVERIEKNGLIAWGITPVQPGIVGVPEAQLPVTLPKVEKYEPTGTGESPLAGIEAWVNTTCPQCGGPAKRETNTMPQWAGSNWYFLRYCDPHNTKQLADPAKLKAWLPVDTYIGGAEHAVLHLLYARFIYEFLFDIGAVPKDVGDEPFTKLINQGLILAEDGQKMSKSRGNVINPDLILREYGADSLRMFEMFMGPLQDAKPWSTRGIVGVRRFLEKVWQLQEKVKDGSGLHRETHALVQQIGDGIESFSLNTAVSNFMKWTNAAATWESVSRKEFEIFLTLLSPFAPHLAQELWSQLGHADQVHAQSWPTFNVAKVVAEEVEIVVQVNGKVRDRFTVPSGTTEEDLQTQALQAKKIQQWLAGKQPKKVIVVKGKLVSIVV